LSEGRRKHTSSLWILGIIEISGEFMYRRGRIQETSSNRNLASFIDQSRGVKDRGKAAVDNDNSVSIRASLLHESMEPGEIADIYRLDTMEKGKSSNIEFHKKKAHD
jgi:hypothetical protein